MSTKLTNNFQVLFACVSTNPRAAELLGALSGAVVSVELPHEAPLSSMKVAGSERKLFKPLYCEGDLVLVFEDDVDNKIKLALELLKKERSCEVTVLYFDEQNMVREAILHAGSSITKVSKSTLTSAWEEKCTVIVALKPWYVQRFMANPEPVTVQQILGDVL